MIDLSTYYGRVIYPDWSPEKIADEIARFNKFQIDELFRRGIEKRTIRQDNWHLDNILSGVRKVLRVEDLDSFVTERIVKWGHRHTSEAIRTEAEHKFIGYRANDVYELYCLSHPRVTPEQDKKHKDVDVWVDGCFPFDLKVTPWPERLSFKRLKKQEEKLGNCINDPRWIIEWMYKNQGEKRWNWQNRLFIICYDAQDFDHIRLKSDFSNMREIIKSYFDHFDSSKLTSVSQKELLGTVTTSNSKGRLIQETALADVIWNYKDYRIHPPRYPGGLAPMDGYQATMF